MRRCPFHAEVTAQKSWRIHSGRVYMVECELAVPAHSRSVFSGNIRSLQARSSRRLILVCEVLCFQNVLISCHADESRRALGNFAKWSNRWLHHLTLPWQVRIANICEHLES